MKQMLLRTLKVAGVLMLMVIALAGYNYLRNYVFWSPSEQASFASGDGTRIGGTLIKPSDQGIYPAVIILHGAGPENINAIDYRTVANAFVRYGFAVLLYDKRGVGASEGDFRSASYTDFIADAIASVEHLARREDIDAGSIGIHAISEGAWFALEVAHRAGNVAFIVNKVGSPFSWMDTVIWEVESDLLAAGVEASDLDPLLELSFRRWQYYVDAGTDPGLAEGGLRDAINAEMQRLMALYPAASGALPRELAPYDAEAYAIYAANFSYDPGPYLEMIDVPTIYLYGTDDINIPTTRSVEFLEKFRDERRKDIDIVVYDGLGHGLITWRGILDGGYAPGYLDLIGTWAAEKLVR